MAQLMLPPQLKAMLDSEAYHYCADCHSHCRQTILAVEAAKEAIKAHASDAEQLMELRRAAESALRRYDNEDSGGLATRDGLAWAMAEDLRTALNPSHLQKERQ